MQKPDIPIGDSIVFCKFPMEKEGDTQYIPLYALGWMLII